MGLGIRLASNYAGTNGPGNTIMQWHLGLEAGMMSRTLKNVCL